MNEYNQGLKSAARLLPRILRSLEGKWEHVHALHTDISEAEDTVLLLRHLVNLGYLVTEKGPDNRNYYVDPTHYRAWMGGTPKADLAFELMTRACFLDEYETACAAYDNSRVSEGDGVLESNDVTLLLLSGPQYDLLIYAGWRWLGWNGKNEYTACSPTTEVIATYEEGVVTLYAPWGDVLNQFSTNDPDRIMESWAHKYGAVLATADMTPRHEIWLDAQGGASLRATYTGGYLFHPLGKYDDEGAIARATEEGYYPTVVQYPDGSRKSVAPTKYTWFKGHRCLLQRQHSGFVLLRFSTNDVLESISMGTHELRRAVTVALEQGHKPTAWGIRADGQWQIYPLSGWISEARREEGVHQANGARDAAGAD